MTNSFATIALLAWPLFSLILFFNMRAAQATLWTILGAQLLLPNNAVIKFEMLPPIDKNSVSSFAALLGYLMFRRLRPRARKFGMLELLLITFSISPVITSLMNNDPVFVGGTVIPAVGYYDGASAFENACIILIPFLLGRYCFEDEKDFAEIFRVIVLAWLAYSLLVLFEIRMSPQLHGWLYGYSSGLIMEMRYGGFRPRVFMENGLILALFGMTAAVAATAFWRTKTRIAGWAASGVTIYFGILLVLCKSFGALLYGAFLLPLVRFATPRFQLRIAASLVTIAVIYPLLRTADLVPTQSMVDLANLASPERSRSLEFRFDQEKMLLEHASDRFLFGWGRFGRSRIVSEDGEDHSITDGHWVVTMGQFGFIGFLAEFGLIAWGVFRATSVLRFVNSKNAQVFLAALGLIVSITLIDQLPNSSITPWTLLLAGALTGRAEALASARRQLLSSKGLNKLKATKASAQLWGYNEPS